MSSFRRLALAYFLRSQIDLGNEIQRAIEGILTDAFSGIQYRIENLLRRNGIHLDESQAYRVMLVEFEDRSVSEMEVDFKGSLAQLAHRYTDVILCPLTWNGRGLVIMPDVDRIADQALCEHAKVMQDLLHDWQQDFSKRHQVRLDCGLGDLHVLPEIQKSYQEARLALSYGRTKHEHGFSAATRTAASSAISSREAWSQLLPSAARRSGVCSTTTARMTRIS